MEIYKEYSRIVVEAEEDVNFTLDLWKCFRTGEITTYSLADKYRPGQKKDLEFNRFIKYLGVDVTTEEWNKRSALVISEEDVMCPYRYCDGESRVLYKFHWLVESKLNIVNFNPEGIYLVE